MHSATVAVSISGASWWTTAMPSCVACCGEAIAARVRSLMAIAAPSGWTTPVRILASVDLPLPLAPSSAWTWPSATAMPTSSRTRSPEYDLVMLSATIAIRASFFGGRLFDRVVESDRWIRLRVGHDVEQRDRVAFGGAIQRRPDVAGTLDAP